MKRRLLAAMLCIAMIASLLPTAAWAAEDATGLIEAAVQAVMDKTAEGEALKTEMETFKADMEASVKNPAENAVVSLSAAMPTGDWSDEAENAAAGTDFTYEVTANEVHILTEIGFAWFAAQVNAGSLTRTAVYLEADIDLDGKLWTSVGDDSSHPFTGNFDGQGHIISNLYNNSGCGLFNHAEGTNAEHITIKNLTLKNVYIDSSNSVGLIVHEANYTDFEKITVTGDIIANGAVAGIAYCIGKSESYVVVKNCSAGTADSKIYVNDDFYGIAYEAHYGTSITDCSVAGTVYCAGDFRGIAAYAEYGATINGCTVDADVYATEICGIAYEMRGNNDGTVYYGQNTIENCTVSINAYASADLFGIAYGLEDDSAISNCAVSGIVYAVDKFCGLAYSLYNGGSVTDCNITGKAYADTGAAGFEYVYWDRDTEKAATISGISVDLTGYYASDGSGLVLYTTGSVTISDCSVAGKLYYTGDYNFGGVVSEAEYDSVSSYGKIYLYGSHKNGTSSRYCLISEEEGHPGHTLNASSYHTGWYYYYGTATKYFDDTLSIKNCTVSAPIYIGLDPETVGGILGTADVHHVTIDNCHVTGGVCLGSDEDVGYSAQYVGGLVGNPESCDGNFVLTNSGFTGDILYCTDSIHTDGVGGLIGSDSSWSVESTLLENCQYTGNIILYGADINVDRLGGLGACLDGDRLTVKNCAFAGAIIAALNKDVDDGGAGSAYHWGGLFGGWKYPDYGLMQDCTFTGSFTVLGTEKAEFDMDHFGMIIGENCAETTVLNSVTVNGDYYSDYATAGSYFGGGIGHRCCDSDLTATNVVVNTNITMEHCKNDFSSSVVAGFIGDCGNDPLVAENCGYNGEITINMLEGAEIGTVSGFLGNKIDETTLTQCNHEGSITVTGGNVETISGFVGECNWTDKLNITDSYSFGDILVENTESVVNVGQWIGYGGNFTDVYIKNSFCVGDITVDVEEGPEYIGGIFGYAATDAFTMDNFYYAGTIDVSYTSGSPTIGYIAGTIDGVSPVLTNVYYDEALYADSSANDDALAFEGDSHSSVYEARFVPLSTIQMQTNRYEADDSFDVLNGSPAVAEPNWDYLNGSDYAEESGYKMPLVDALNAGKDGYLNWKVDGESFRGYPFFGQTWTILYYVDFGNGYELQHIEQFDQKGVTAQEIPTPDQMLYPNSEYQWQDRNGVTFTAKTRLFGDKMVYADLISYYTVQYIANYPNDLAITPTDNDILENGYITGATVTVRSNNTFTIPDGYNFKEWNTEADGTGNSVAAFTQEKIEKENLIFYAIWEKLPEQTYSVYYVANGGNGDMWDAVKYESGNTVTVKANEFEHPDGFEFIGFLEYETETLYEESDTFTITRDTYLIAQWKAPAPTFSVTYIASGGDGTMIDDTAYESGDEVTVLDNAFTMNGYEFAGFIDLDNNQYDEGDTFIIEKDTVLVAQWVPVKYSVTYHGNGASEADVVDCDYMSGTTVTIRDGEFTFTREGYSFLYWSLTADGEKAYSAYDAFAIKSNVELYAIWECNPITPPTTLKVIYKSGGGTGTMTDDALYYSGNTVTVQANGFTAPEGKDFAGFINSVDWEVYQPGDTFTITADTILTAQWEPAASDPLYAVTYVANGASGVMIDSSSPYAPGTTVTVLPNAYTYTKNTFNGFLNSVDGNVYQPGDVFTITKDTTLIAQWTIHSSSGGGGGGSGTAEISGTINILKVDSIDSDRYLSGATFKLYSSSDALIGIYTTDANGQISVSNLKSGSYYAIETSSPEGYLLDSSKHTFSVTAGKTTTLTVKNERTAIPSVFCDDHYAYIIGYADGNVHPEANITRAEVATIFFRLLSDEVRDTNWTTINSFSDVNSDMWCNNAISTMAKMGIVSGYEDGTFKPTNPITRAEFAAIAARFDSNGNPTTASFSDIANHWAKQEISVAANNGWITGYTDGTFKPDRNITRAEAMTLVNRVLQRIPQSVSALLSDMITWPDNKDTSKWYYLAVQEATNSHRYSRNNDGTETWTSLREVRDWAALERQH